MTSRMHMIYRSLALAMLRGRDRQCMSFREGRFSGPIRYGVSFRISACAGFLVVYFARNLPVRRNNDTLYGRPVQCAERSLHYRHVDNLFGCWDLLWSIQTSAHVSL